jgi:hypothetical protein
MTSQNAGTHRRKILVICGASFTTIAGCTTDDSGPSSGSDDTAGALSDDSDSLAGIVERFINAVAAGDRDTIDSLVHPGGELAGEASTLAERGETREIISIQTEVAGQAENEAFVTTQLEYRNEDGETTTEDDVFALRKNDGSWRIYKTLNKVPLEYRIEGVTPADSFRTTIGLEESSAEQFFRAVDVSAVDLSSGSESENQDRITVTFSEEIANQIQATAADLEDDLMQAKIFEYLDSELTNTFEMTTALARLFQSGQWAADPRFILAYEDAELAERVAATILENIED